MQQLPRRYGAPIARGMQLILESDDSQLHQQRQQIYSRSIRTIFPIMFILTIYSIYLIVHSFSEFSFTLPDSDQMVFSIKGLQNIGIILSFIQFIGASQTRKIRSFNYFIIANVLQITLRIIICIEMFYCYVEVSQMIGRQQCKLTFKSIFIDILEAVAYIMIFLVVSVIVLRCTQTLDELKKMDKAYISD